MLRSVRRFRTGWLTGGLHLIIVWIALEAESAEVWPFALAAMSAVSLAAWAANYRRYRQVHDLPTSRIASAAQGYVELVGRSLSIADAPVIAPLSKQPCCWYSYQIERKTSDDKWRHEDSGESVEHFLLVDGTGQCVISPDGAEVMYARSNRWTEGSHRYTEELLLPHGTLYALGEFRTTSGASLALNENADVRDLIAEWKKDPPALLARFDADKSGALDLKEWEDARLVAQREVRKRHVDLRANAGEGVHMVSKPRDGRVFILAAAMPDAIGRRFAFWSWAHLAAFFATGIGSFLLF